MEITLDTGILNRPIVNCERVVNSSIATGWYCYQSINQSFITYCSINAGLDTTQLVKLIKIAMTKWQFINRDMQSVDSRDIQSSYNPALYGTKSSYREIRKPVQWILYKRIAKFVYSCPNCLLVLQAFEKNSAVQPFIVLMHIKTMESLHIITMSEAEQCSMRKAQS